MKIAVLAPNAHAGGEETYANMLKDAVLGIPGAECEILAPNKLGIADRDGLPGPIRDHDRQKRFAKACRKRFKSDRPDLVIANGDTAIGLTSRSVGAPVVHIYHYTSTGIMEANAMVHGQPVGGARRRVCVHIDKSEGKGCQNVSVSEWTRDEVKKVAGIDSKVIVNGVDLEFYRPTDGQSIRDIVGVADDEPLVLSVARNVPLKGWSLARQVAESLPDTKFAWLSSGMQGPVPENVSLLPVQDLEAMPAVYSAADVLLNPSVYEPFGYVPLEALACGTPVVAYRTGAVAELGPDRIGALVAEYDASRFVDELARVLENPPDDVRSAVAERFDARKWAREWQDYVQSLL